MLSAHRSSAIVTRAIDILTAAGLSVHYTHGLQPTDQDEFEAKIAETLDSSKRQGGDVSGHGGQTCGAIPPVHARRSR